MYLLGQLSEAEQEELEQNYFNDNDTFIQLVEAEEDLINDYLQNLLPRRQRRLFERHYLTIPGKQRKVEFIQLLNQSEARQLYLGGPKPTVRRHSLLQRLISDTLKLNRPLGQSLAAAVLLITAGVLIWLARSVPEPLIPLESAKTPSEDGAGSLAKSAGSPTVNLYLSPRFERSRSQSLQRPTVSIDDRTQSIELKLALAGSGYPRYHGRLQRIDGAIKEIASDDTLKPESSDNQKVVVWRLSAAKLPAGDYQIELQGKTDSGDAGNTNFYDLNIRVR
jgi:hypothetical protein